MAYQQKLREKKRVETSRPPVKEYPGGGSVWPLFCPGRLLQIYVVVLLLVPCPVCSWTYCAKRAFSVTGSIQLQLRLQPLQLLLAVVVPGTGAQCRQTDRHARLSRQRKPRHGRAVESKGQGHGSVLGREKNTKVKTEQEMSGHGSSGRPPHLSVTRAPPVSRGRGLTRWTVPCVWVPGLLAPLSHPPPQTTALYCVPRLCLTVANHHPPPPNSRLRRLKPLTSNNAAPFQHA